MKVLKEILLAIQAHYPAAYPGTHGFTLVENKYLALELNFPSHKKLVYLPENMPLEFEPVMQWVSGVMSAKRAKLIQ